MEERKKKKHIECNTISHDPAIQKLSLFFLPELQKKEKERVKRETGEKIGVTT